VQFALASTFRWQPRGKANTKKPARFLLMIDPSTNLAIAESFLQPMGPVAAEQLRHLKIVTLLTLIAVVPVMVSMPWILWRYRAGFWSF
jgi:heme/copper-type cytochrome/quinol oxidase subunit 2